MPKKEFAFIIIVCIDLVLIFQFSLSPSLNRESKSIKRETFISNQQPEASDYTTLWNLMRDTKNLWLQNIAQLKRNNERMKIPRVNEGYIYLRRSLEEMMEKTESTRSSEIRALSKFIQHKITVLQNPTDCESARILICELNFRCGFGCYTHYLTNCMIQAFESERVMVYRPETVFHYVNEGWNSAFQPLTKCSVNKEYSGIPFITEKDAANERIVKVNPQTLPDWLSWTIPSELAPKLFAIHGDPFAWWISQFVHYVLRYNDEQVKKLQDKMDEIQIQGPMAGIHVRRGDKLDHVADFHSVDEYMFHVQNWYQQVQLNNPAAVRAVYVATDDSTVLPELMERYPGYKFITSNDVSQNLDVKDRYSAVGFESVISDIHFLSQCDYIVCTLTSNVCRVSYELKMHRVADPSTRIESLDIPYKFKTVFRKPYKAVLDHSPKTEEEMELKVGDEIRISLAHHRPFNEGFMYGEHQSTNKTGIVPTFKIREMIHQHSYSILKK